ncbi:unnamed protein product, partial [Prunus brigantina]
MVKIWSTAREVVVKDIVETLFLFIFATEADRQKVLRGGPWNFDKALVLLETPDGSVAPSKMILNYADFWVQVHNVPLSCMSTNMGRQIGNSFGRCLDVMEGMDGECLGKFLRIRVSVDVSKPLRRGKKMLLPSGNNVFVEFRYERLPEFCFCCGRMGHVFKVCSFVDQVSKQADDKPYGIWLKATKEFHPIRAGNPKRSGGSGLGSKNTRGLAADDGSGAHGEWLVGQGPVIHAQHLSSDEEGEGVKEREMEEGGQKGSSRGENVAEPSVGPLGSQRVGERRQPPREAEREPAVGAGLASNGEMGNS